MVMKGIGENRIGYGTIGLTAGITQESQSTQRA